MKISAKYRKDYREVRGRWYKRITTNPESWMPVEWDIEFDDEEESMTLEQRTVKVIEEVLEIAPHSDRVAFDGSGADVWESTDWGEAKSRLRGILSEWKGKMSEDST